MIPNQLQAVKGEQDYLQSKCLKSPDRLSTCPQERKKVFFADEANNQGKLTSIKMFEPYDHHAIDEEENQYCKLSKSQTQKCLQQYERDAQSMVLDGDSESGLCDAAQACSSFDVFSVEKLPVQTANSIQAPTPGKKIVEGHVWSPAGSMSMWFREYGDWENLEYPAVCSDNEVVEPSRKRRPR